MEQDIMPILHRLQVIAWDAMKIGVPFCQKYKVHNSSVPCFRSKQVIRQIIAVKPNTYKCDNS